MADDFDVPRIFSGEPGPLDNIAGPNHSDTVTAALDDFHRALTRRWTTIVCDAIVRDSRDFPTAISRATQYCPVPGWDYSSPAARAHIEALLDSVGTHCEFIKWVRSGQPSDLDQVTCQGWTGYHRPEPAQEPVPPYIECGVGIIFRQVGTWAWDERTHIFHKLPMFDHHDLTTLHRVHDELIDLAYQLGLTVDSGSRPTTIPPGLGGTPSIPSKVPTVSSLPQDKSTWWTEWTGLQANRAASGFFHSLTPTLENQACIAVSLANMCSDRAAIIAKGRNDGLYWIQWATESLGETERVTTDRVAGWTTVQGIGLGMSTGWAIVAASATGGATAGSPAGPPGAVAGAAIGTAVASTILLVGFLGANLDPGTRTEEFKHDMLDVVQTLDDEIGRLNGDLGNLERDYHKAATTLQDRIYDIHSFNLETYDFTANTSAGATTPEGSFNTRVDHVLNMSRDCHSIGDLYAGLLPRFASIADADRHLADKDGAQTPADKLVLELRDLLESALKTTSGRYLLAGDQAMTAAEEYAETDDQIRSKLEGWMDDTDHPGLDRPRVPFDEEEHAEATDREGQPGTDDEDEEGFVSPNEGEDPYFVEDEHGNDQAVQVEEQ